MIWQRLIKLIVLSLLLAGCQQKRCQAPPEQPFQTFVGTQWRLVSTTDPGPNFKTLTQTNFLIFTFNRDFTGDIKSVGNNAQSNVPIATLIYRVDSESRLIQAQITQNTVTVPPADGSTPNETPQSVAPKSSTVNFNYTLSREFGLTDSRSGFYYRFVPFLGVINPDQQCTF